MRLVTLDVLKYQRHMPWYAVKGYVIEGVSLSNSILALIVLDGHIHSQLLIVSWSNHITLLLLAMNQESQSQVKTFLWVCVPWTNFSSIKIKLLSLICFKIDTIFDIWDRKRRKVLPNYCSSPIFENLRKDSHWLFTRRNIQPPRSINFWITLIIFGGWFHHLIRPSDNRLIFFTKNNIVCHSLLTL